MIVKKVWIRISVFMIRAAVFVVSVLQIFYFKHASYSFKYYIEELSSGIETSLKTPYVFDILANKPNLAVNMSLTQ